MREAQTHRSVIVMAGTLVAARELSQVAEDVQLVMGDLDVLLEQDPSYALVARWGCQRAKISPVPVVV